MSLSRQDLTSETRVPHTSPCLRLERPFLTETVPESVRRGGDETLGDKVPNSSPCLRIERLLDARDSLSVVEKA